MERETVLVENLNESYVKIKHKSGLLVFLKPMKGFSYACSVFTTRFGSVNSCFRRNKDNDFFVVPDGVAHYLEHKLFENEDGSITFELFSKEKAIANAETSFKNTSYYFSSISENFVNALKILVNFVQTPYFTDENVEKERGIIAQEINMYEDSPETVCFFNCLAGMFFKSSIRLKIAGTVESIAKIDKDVLYECYNTFYSPCNMALTIAGNFNELEVLKMLDKELKTKEAVNFENVFDEEPENVRANSVEAAMPIKTSIFNLGYKLKPKKSEELFKFVVCLEILCELLFGEGSLLYNEFYENGLVVGGEVEYDVLYGENFLALILSGETEKPEMVLEKITQEIELKKQMLFDEEDFLLVKKTKYKDIVKSFSNPQRVANFLTQSYVEDFLELQQLKIIANIKLEDLIECLKGINTNN